tara:strand:+ start:250 stop:645 length:396 start_codon:yes stop_codon:yes gene_type:complete
MNRIDVVMKFLEAISEGKTGDELDMFYDENVIQIEYPNLLTKNLTERDLRALKEASEKGAQVLKSQSFELIKAYECGDTVIIEAKWTGVLAIPIGKLSIGDEMKAHFAQFFDFKNNRIIRQRNYDCFENFL